VAHRLHLVFGGEMVDPRGTEFVDVSAIDVVGVFPDYETAHRAWKNAAQRTVDSAQTRYFIAHLHRLMEESDEGSATQTLEG